MTEPTTPQDAATEGDWIAEVDESTDPPTATGRLLNRFTGETREAPAAGDPGAAHVTNPKTGEIRDAAGRHEGFVPGSRGDDSRGSAPDSTTQTGADADAGTTPDTAKA